LTLFPPPSLNPSDLKIFGSPIQISRSWVITGGAVWKHIWEPKCIASNKNSNTSNNKYANGTKRSLGTFFRRGNYWNKKLRTSKYNSFKKDTQSPSSRRKMNSKGN
jgi:hypothetical protein